MKKVILVVVGGIVGVVAACSSDGGTADAKVVSTKAAVNREMAPTLTGEEQASLAAGQADFAVALYRAIANDNAVDSVFISPHSVSIALGMAYAGAGGTTASEMRTALHLALPDERVHTGFDYLDLELARRGQGATGQDGKPFQLSIANSIWGQTGLPIENPFLDTLALDYGAGVNRVDFASSPDGSRGAINSWVEDQTANRIKDLMPPNTVTTNTKLVLVDAVYFNAGWQTKFTREGTSRAPFTKLDGSQVDVSMMNMAATLPYAKGDGYEAVALPYEGGELSMLVIVPDAGTFASFENGLAGAKVLDIANAVSPTQLLLAYPKHHFEGAYDLKASLRSLGMNVAFEGGGADFNGIVKGGGLFIDQVLQKTFVDVDEAGTEAAAATAVSFADAGVSALPSTRLAIDRPFVEAIVDAKTKSLVFLGRIVEPKTK